MRLQVEFERGEIGRIQARSALIEGWIRCGAAPSLLLLLVFRIQPCVTLTFPSCERNSVLAPLARKTPTVGNNLRHILWYTSMTATPAFYELSFI